MPPFAETERLIFRPYKESDTPRLFQLMDDLRVRRGEPWPLAPNHPTFSARIPEMIKSSMAWLIIESKNPPAEGKGVRESDDAPDDDRFVGQVVLHSSVAKNRCADIGISIEPRWWGQGIGTEAVKWIIDFAFEEYGLNRIGLECDGHNLRAVGAYKKAGFVEEGRKREAVWQGNEWHDQVIMGLLRREWEATRAAKQK